MQVFDLTRVEKSCTSANSIDSKIFNKLLSAWKTPSRKKTHVPGMDCVACPITVKKALTKVPGVSKAQVSLERREAKVSFDDSKTNIEEVTRATKHVGYPSTLLGPAK